MRKLLFILIFLSGGSLYAQFTTICKDTLTQPDLFYQCGLSAGGDEYNPVCGCDNVTYRNACAAIHWGALFNWTANTICGNFHIDLRPTFAGINPIKFQAYIRNITSQNISISIYIYDAFGKIKYTFFDATSRDGIYPTSNSPLEIPVQSLTRGIYLLVVIVNNEKQYIKFARVTE